MKKNKSRSQKTLAMLKADIQRPNKRYAAIHQFRTSMPEEFYFSTYKSIFGIKNSLNDYHGSPFPKKADQIFGNGTPKRPVSAYRELLWAVARCITFHEELKAFVQLKEAFEVSILMGEHADAIKHLTSVKDSFGKSIWLYQNMLAAAFSSAEDNAPADMSKEIAEDVKDNPVLGGLLHFMQRRIEGATLRDQLRSDLIGNVESEVLRNHFLARVVDIASSKDVLVSNLLFVDAQSSLIDHYSSLIHALQAAVSDQKITVESGSCIVSGLGRLYELTRDKRLLGILSGLGAPHIDSLASIKHREAAIEAYTQASYEEALDLAESVLQMTPLDSAIRLLFVKAHVALGRTIDSTTGMIGEIHRNLFNVLSANESFFVSAHALVMLADRFYDHNWMQFVRMAVFYEIGSEQDDLHQLWMRDQCVRDIHLSPWLALTVRADRAEKVAAFLEASKSYPKTLQLVKLILSTNGQHSVQLSSREARYMARQELAKKNYKKASDLYIESTRGEHRAAVKLRSLGGAALAQILDGQLATSVETLIQAHLECPNALTILPVRELVEKMPEIDQWPNVISLSMLFNLSLQMHDTEDLSKTRLAFEKFCEDNSIFSPKDLAARLEEFGRNHVISFLETVWRPEVMRQTLLYGSASDIEDARIEACQVLARIDPDKARAYQQELASRIKQQEIAKASALVEQSKVYVDIEAIKRSLRSKLKGSYGQYKNSVGQHGKSRDEVIEAIKKVFVADESMSLSTLLSQVHAISLPDAGTQADAQFNSLFTEITREFLTGDHGLNAYLSTRVRHGKFVDALRKPVMDQHLVTSRFDDGSYAANGYWNEGLLPDTESKIAVILEKFSRNFDELLFNVRDKRIQIRTFMGFQVVDNNNSEGLFVYQFSNLERRLMQSYDSDFKDLGELISKCVDILWEKTDANLEVVRAYLSNTLSGQINTAFKELNREILTVCLDNIPPGMSNAIARAGTATQQALGNVVAWFRRSEVYDRQDFDIDLPAQIAASMVRRIMATPDYWNGPMLDTQGPNSKLPGRLLDDLVDIYYALFENAVQYADQANIRLRINVCHEYSGGELRASITSDTVPPTEEQLAKLDSLRESLFSEESRRLAQSEGRSGFRKIILALSRPVYKSSSLDFQYSSDDKFRVSFSFKITDVL